MLEALPYFLGTHDFSSFANSLSPLKNPVKTIFELTLIPTESGFTLKFRGDGFLYKMVRNITGTLLEIGRGKLGANTIPTLLSLKSRAATPAAAPPHALFLEAVLY